MIDRKANNQLKETILGCSFREFHQNKGKVLLNMPLRAVGLHIPIFISKEIFIFAYFQVNNITFPEKVKFLGKFINDIIWHY